MTHKVTFIGDTFGCPGHELKKGAVGWCDGFTKPHETKPNVVVDTLVVEFEQTDLELDFCRANPSLFHVEEL